MISLRNICTPQRSAGGAAGALDDVCLEIGRGDYLSITGSPGSGTSALFRVLGLLERAGSGRYLLEDYDMNALPDRERARIRRRRFGFLFRDFELLPELSALENVMLPMGYAGLPARRRRERAELLLEELGLGRRLLDRPASLSSRDRQKVAMARSLANGPDAILADEPTGNLPSKMGEELISILESLNAKGVAIVLVTHDPELGRRARRRLHIRDGLLGREAAIEPAGCHD